MSDAMSDSCPSEFLQFPLMAEGGRLGWLEPDL